MEMQLRMIAFIVLFGVLQKNQVDSKAVLKEVITGEDKIQENLRNLFNSIAKKEMRKVGTYRDVLEQETAMEEEAFDMVKREVQSEQRRNAHKQSNVPNKNLGIVGKTAEFKREIQGNSYEDDVVCRIPDELNLDEEYAKLEHEYVQHFGNDPQNPQGLWPEAKAMAENETLETFCSRTHFLNGQTSYEFIFDPEVRDGTLHFIKSKENYKPMQITVVNYVSQKNERSDFYITKGMRADCLLYLNPLDEQKTTFHVTRHMCDCVFFLENS